MRLSEFTSIRIQWGNSSITKFSNFERTSFERTSLAFCDFYGIDDLRDLADVLQADIENV